MTDWCEKMNAAQYIGCKDFDIIDDMIYDDKLEAHREEIYAKIKMAYDELHAAAIRMAIELYGEAAAWHKDDARVCESFTLRTSEMHELLSDALLNLRNDGFFKTNR